MKTTICILAFALAVHFTFANDEKYLQQMAKNIEIVYEAKTTDELQQGINALERIAGTEKTKWEPYYYVAFGYTMMSNLEPLAAKKDAYLDQAVAALKQATALHENESEIIVLEGFVSMMRVTVDPATRGQQYSGLAFQAYQKALALNPENPRALGMLAQMQYGTAQFFKSPVTEACATAKKALEKFETYKSENPLAPQWGKGMTEGLLSKCK